MRIGQLRLSYISVMVGIVILELSFYLYKLAFVHTTDRACPVIWQLFKKCSGCNSADRIPCLGVVYISAHCAFV